MARLAYLAMIFIMALYIFMLRLQVPPMEMLTTLP